MRHYKMKKWKLYKSGLCIKRNDKTMSTNKTNVTENESIKLQINEKN